MEVDQDETPAVSSSQAPETGVNPSPPIGVNQPRDVAKSPSTSPFPFVPDSPLATPPLQAQKRRKEIIVPDTDKRTRYFRKIAKTSPLDRKVTFEFSRMSDLARAPLVANEVTCAFKLFNAIEVTLDPGETKLLNTHVRISAPRGFYGTIVGAQDLAIEKGIHTVTTTLDCNFR